ncbi:DUF4132 domain-containing protein [Nocardia sp. CA-145437]|uniref:DUF4132 domain-containing protein n=1 Tax=Nocardia sp. CA-145437 TaxID=3239980 RepID=UPI003D951C67
MTDEQRWADPQATEAVRKLLRRHRGAVETVLTAARVDGLDQLADAAAGYVAAPERAGAAVGAAVAFAIAQYAAVAYRTGARRRREFIDRFIDSWMVEFGHAFASEVAAARVGVRVEEPDPRAGRMTAWLRVIEPGQDVEPAAEALRVRVRERLGNTPEGAGRVAPEPKSVTTDQIRRLEAAMVDGRRWRAAAHRRLVLEDPALGPAARLLVWAVFDARGAVTGAFRLDEERVLRNLEGAPVELTDQALVGVAHPIQLGETLAAWRDLFDDNRLRQPFEQLERPINLLTSDDAESNRLSRFSDQQIRTDRVFGLQQLGWQVSREVLTRRFGPVREVVVTLDPGLEGGFRDEPELQRVLSVELRGGTFDSLDAVSASELIRQLERLAA